MPRTHLKRDYGVLLGLFFFSRDTIEKATIEKMEKNLLKSGKIDERNEESNKQRVRQTETDREIERQIDRKTDRQAVRKTNS